MKWIIALLLVASIAFGSEVIIDEGFQGYVFPPMKWKAGEGWSKSLEGSNYFAHGTKSNQGLWTPYFDLDRKWQPIKLSFNYRSKGNSSILYRSKTYKLSEVDSWTVWNKVLTTEKLYDHRIAFSYMDFPSGYLDLDNVVITKCSTGVESTSWGKVKALYN